MYTTYIISSKEAYFGGESYFQRRYIPKIICNFTRLLTRGGPEGAGTAAAPPARAAGRLVLVLALM